MNMIVENEVAEVSKVVAKAKAKIGKLVAYKDGVRAHKLKNGGISFQGIVRGADGKKRTKSFATREEAVTWRNAELAKAPEVVVAEQQQAKPGKMTMAELFAFYVAKSAEDGNPLPEGQVMMFNRLSRHPMLAELLVTDMTANQARAYCSSRKNIDKVHPSTVMAEFIRLNVALRRVGEWNEWGKEGAPFNPLNGVMEKLRRDKLVADSTQRDRRPVNDELPRLIAHFTKVEAEEQATLIEGKAMPMADIVAFAALNAFRRDEITRLTWSSLSADGSSIKLARKDSSNSTGRRDCVVPLLPAALEIIKRQPRVDGEDRIFPFVGDTISQRFTDACKKLGIEDLRFHDLRHEAISTLATVLGVAEAMLISGHKTMRSFMRYVNLEIEAARISKKTASITLKLAV